MHFNLYMFRIKQKKMLSIMDVSIKKIKNMFQTFKKESEKCALNYPIK